MIESHRKTHGTVLGFLIGLTFGFNFKHSLSNELTCLQIRWMTFCVPGG